MASRHLTSDSPNFCAGFSFLEVIVALAILAAVLSVIINSQVELIRARDRVYAMEQASYVSQRIAARVWLNMSPSDAVAAEDGPWIIEYEPVQGEGGEEEVRWDSFVIAPSNYPSQKTTLYLRQSSMGSAGEQPKLKKGFFKNL